MSMRALRFCEQRQIDQGHIAAAGVDQGCRSSSLSAVCFLEHSPL